MLTVTTSLLTHVASSCLTIPIAKKAEEAGCIVMVAEHGRVWLDGLSIFHAALPVTATADP